MSVSRITPKKFAVLNRLGTFPRPTLEELDALYRGYVAKTNEMLEHLERADRSAAHPVYSEWRSIHSEIPIAIAAVKSYEIFLGHMGGRGGEPQGALAEQIRRDFGTFRDFLSELEATAIASRGWAAVVWDEDAGRLRTVLGDTPENLSVWRWQPVMVLEVSDRSASVDFARNRRRYLQALFENLDWDVIEHNFERVVGPAPLPA
jgi:Fe-Mn family superoxide dismutase